MCPEPTAQVKEERTKNWKILCTSNLEAPGELTTEKRTIPLIDRGKSRSLSFHSISLLVFHQNVKEKLTPSCGQLRNAVKPWSIAFLLKPSSQTSLRQACWGNPNAPSDPELHYIASQGGLSGMPPPSQLATNPILPSFDAPRTLIYCSDISSAGKMGRLREQIEGISWLFSPHHV